MNKIHTEVDNKINKYLFEKDDFVKNYDKLKSSRKMAELYGCAKSTILSYAKSINYTNKYPGKLSEQQKNEIILAYDTCTSNELAEKYSMTNNYVEKIDINILLIIIILNQLIHQIKHIF